MYNANIYCSDWVELNYTATIERYIGDLKQHFSATVY